MAQKIPIYIPTYIASQTYQPARVLPRLFFYNGTLECEPYYFNSLANGHKQISRFPYFDNYNVITGQFPTSGSLSLLFNNEAAAYGDLPTESLYSTYWAQYVSLLYNPYTRLFDCEAIIPLADYFNMELNDIVEWRGNYYHLRAINDYNLTNGECKLQLLGPIIPNALDYINGSCDFNFTSSTITTTTTTTAGPTTTTTSTTTTSTTTTAGPTTTTTTTLAPPPSGSVVTNGLVLWQACDSLTGSIWYDKSGNGNNAFISGGFTVSNTGVNFDGFSNTYVGWANEPLNATPSSSFTMIMYGKFSPDVNGELFNKRVYTNGWDSVWVATSFIGNDYVAFRDLGGFDRNAVYGDINTTPSMVSIALEATGSGYGNVYAWKNTTPLTVSPQVLTAWNGFNAASGSAENTRLKFGNQTSVDAGPFSGSISNLMIYNRKLSDAEILQNYNYISAQTCVPGPTTTTTTIAPTGYFQTLACCDGITTSIVQNTSSLPINSTDGWVIYNPNTGNCERIVAIVAPTTPSFTITNDNQGTYVYGYGAGQCNRCKNDHPCI